jgi:hypothetical protein
MDLTTLSMAVYEPYTEKIRHSGEPRNLNSKEHEKNENSKKTIFRLVWPHKRR